MAYSQDKNNAGFTLLELMLTVAIIAIIASIAIPSYVNYIKKTHYSELVRATAPYKLGVVQCYNMTGTFINCNSGANESQGIPPAITKSPTGHSAIGQISVVNGVITAIPNAVNGIKSEEDYILTPTAANGIISWTVSGKAIKEGLTK